MPKLFNKQLQMAALFWKKFVLVLKKLKFRHFTKHLIIKHLIINAYFLSHKNTPFVS